MPELAAEPGTFFPNAPLKEAAFEVRFNPLLKIERDLAQFQEQITEDYPLLGKEMAPSSGEEPLTTFLFHTSDKKKTIRTSVRSFGFSTTEYHGFVPFKRELLEKTNAFCKCYEISAFTRVGLRYINNIEIPERDGWFDFTEFVHPLLDLERVSPKELYRIAQEIILTKQTGALVIRSGLIPLPPLPAQTGRKAIYVLDLDFYTEDVTGADKLSTLLDSFHDEIEREFLTQVTKPMVAIMKGSS